LTENDARMIAGTFAPFDDLAHELMSEAGIGSDGAHDGAHLARVWANVRKLHVAEGGDLEVLAAAVLLHDCVAVAKNSPQRSMASRLSAEKASIVLTTLGWNRARVQTVADAILTHSYSANLTPNSLEGCILQDADRLDAIGFVGIARCFYTAGRMGSRLYAPFNPEGEGRTLDDLKFALDHFPVKLLRLTTGFKTQRGQQIARESHEICKQFYYGMLQEILPG
jgi:uncharacterized protein